MAATDALGPAAVDDDELARMLAAHHGWTARPRCATSR